jgi:hypothetical protein
MAAWRRAIELSLGDADVVMLRSMAQSRTEPASRVERARILLGYWKDPSFFAETPNNSADLIHAHGVFVYIPFLVTYRYFEEIVRVAAPHSFVAFDIVSEPCLDDKTVANWLQAGDEYLCFLSKGYVIDFFAHRGFQEIHSFLVSSGAGLSEYLIFRRQ